MSTTKRGKARKGRGAKDSNVTRSELERRDLLRAVGTIAATGMVGCDVPDEEEEVEEEELAQASDAVTGQFDWQFVPEELPAATPGAVVGRQGYCANSTVAGQQLPIMISSDTSYDLRLVKPGWTVRDTVLDCDYGLLGTSAVATPQLLRQGSYVHISRAVNEPAIQALTLECWVRPFKPSGYSATRRGLISQHRLGEAHGFGLLLEENLRPTCCFGSGILLTTLTSPFAISHAVYATSSGAAWSHIVAVFNSSDWQGKRIRLYVNGVEVANHVGEPVVYSGNAPIRIGAYGEGSSTKNFLDGDIAGVAIYSRALTSTEIADRFSEGVALPPADPPANVEGAWDFQPGPWPTVVDTSGNFRHGLVINHGSNMIGGPGFDATTTGAAPTTHAARFTRSDLTDCRWAVSHNPTIPAETPPGLYVARMLNKNAAPPPNDPPASPRGYDIPIVVKRASGKPKAPILVLAATNTWHVYKQSWAIPCAYNGVPGGAIGASTAPQTPVFFTGTRVPLLPSNENAWFSSALSSVPIQSMLYQKLDTLDAIVDLLNFYHHGVAAERPLHVWLEQNGYDYDVATDFDVSSSELNGYRVVFIVGHSEYWSADMVSAVETYLGTGGQVICISGNTMFWRVARVGASNEIIEVRKALGSALGGVQIWPGESFHEADGLVGGLWRAQAGDRAAWQVLGLDTAGYGPFSEALVADIHEGTSGVPEVHPFLTAPENTALQIGDSLGGPNTVGHEFDVRYKTFAGAVVPPGHAPVLIARATAQVQSGDGGYALSNYAVDNAEALPVVNEIVDYSPPDGGRVLNAGSIATAAALIGLNVAPTATPPLSKFFRNALHAMHVEQRLTICAIRSSDKHLVTSVFNPTSNAFNNLQSHGVASSLFNSASSPNGMMFAPNEMGIMAVDQAGWLRYKYIVPAASPDLSAPYGWQDLGNNFAGRPAVVSWSRNRTNVFVRSSTGQMVERIYNGTSWAPGPSLGSGIAYDPAAIVQDGIRFSLAAVSSASWTNGAGRILYNYRYCGAERDEETGFYCMGARYYCPWLARWTTSDPLGLQAGINVYLYCRAGPVTLSDPSGLEPTKPGIPFGTGTISWSGGLTITFDAASGSDGASGGASTSPGFGTVTGDEPPYVPIREYDYSPLTTDDMVALYEAGWRREHWNATHPIEYRGPAAPVQQWEAPSPTSTYIDHDTYQRNANPQRLWIFDNLGPSLGTSIGQITGNETAGAIFDFAVTVGHVYSLKARGSIGPTSFRKLNLTEPWGPNGTGSIGASEATVGTEITAPPGSYSRSSILLTERAAAIQQSFIDAGVLGPSSKRFNPVAVTQGNVPGMPRIVTVGSMKAYLAIKMGQVALAEGEVLGPAPMKRVGGRLPPEGHVEVVGILEAENSYGATGGFVGTIPPQCETCSINMKAVPNWTHTNPRKP